MSSATYPGPEPPPLSGEGWIRLPCKAQSPSWGYEGEGNQCLRTAHDDPWHYYEDDWVQVWWLGTLYTKRR